MPLPSVTDVLQQAADRRRGLLAKLAALNIAIALLLCLLVYFVLSASRQTVTNQTQAVAENLASEQSARMVAMKAASDNAGNVIGELRLVYNKTRQAAITKELSEIVAGAAAV